VKEKFNIVNNPTALLKVFELAGERLAEIKNEFRQNSIDPFSYSLVVPPLLSL